MDKNGKPFGYIRVENPAKVTLGYAYDGNNVKKGQSALVAMTVDAWDKNKQYYSEGMSIKGNVRIVESLEAGKGFKAKMAGNKDNAIACTLGGRPIYRRTEFDPTGKLEDVLIEHDNAEAISALAKVAAVQATTALNEA